VQPEAATELGDRKAGSIAPLLPDVVATGNPGCLLQIQSALARAGLSIPVVHTMQVVDASIRGCEPPSWSQTPIRRRNSRFPAALAAGVPIEGRTSCSTTIHPS